MSVKFGMPKAGLTMIEGTIVEWLVQEGAEVKKGDIAFTYENEKTTMECEAPESGYIHLVAKVGDVVKVGDPVAYLAESQEAYEKLVNKFDEEPTKNDAMCAKNCTPCAKKIVAQKAGEIQVEMSNIFQDENKDRIRSSGLARNIARKHGVDLRKVTGTGPNGRVLSKDVEAYIKNAEQGEKSTQAIVACQDEVVKVPLTSARRAIANNLKYSIDTMVQASSSTEFDVTDLFALRAKLVAEQEKIGWKITINDLLVMATVKVLKKHPLLNATFDGETITSYPHVNINIAVAAESGLAIPVVREVDKMTLLELSKALRDVAVRAREGKLRPGEQTGGSFTVSNVGMYPIDHGSPIANAPQVGIFGFGRPVERLAKRNGEICERKMMHVMFTFDHRVFDGLEQGLIMRDLQMYLEHPELMLI